MSKKLLGAAAAALLVIALIQTAVLWQTPNPIAGHGPTAHATSEMIAERLSQFGPVTKVVYNQTTGLFRAVVGGDIVYVTADGQYLLSGDLYDLQTRRNLTAALRKQQRQQTLAELDIDNAIVYEPEGKTRAVVWVFTDVTCPYCQMFHSHIHGYTARGIEVRYLAFPRGGPNSRGWRLAESVWCADNSRKALTQAKAHPSRVPLRQCKSAPIRKQYQAGLAMGIQGTPLIMTSEGRKLGGYLPPEQLAARLHLKG